MIKLLTPLNHRGGIVEAGKEIGFLTPEQEKAFVDSKAAEYVTQENKKEKDINDMKKNELLEYAASLEVEGINDTMTKVELMAAITAKLENKE